MKPSVYTEHLIEICVCDLCLARTLSWALDGTEEKKRKESGETQLMSLRCNPSLL